MTTATSVDLRYGTVHLQVNTSSPDPIGFANVNGWYGPGTWVGWYLTVLASWYSILRRRGRGFDLNTWLYLVALNYASFELVRHLQTLRTIQHGGNDAWKKEAASVGAAFVVVCWGQTHAFLQLLVCYRSIVRKQRWSDSQAGITLLFGATFPAAAMVASMWMMGGFHEDIELTSHIPAFYYNNIPNKYAYSLGYSASSSPDEATWLTADPLGHDFALRAPGFLSMYILVFHGVLFYRLCRSSLALRTNEQSAVRFCMPGRLPSRGMIALPRKAWLLIFAALYSGFVFVFIKKGAVAAWYFAPALLPLLPLVVLIAFCFGFVLPVMGQIYICGDYIFRAYFDHVSSIAESCFFMPCAPQAIKETDQAFAVFAGVFSMALTEVVVPWGRRLKQARRERRVFEQDVERRLTSQRECQFQSP